MIRCYFRKREKIRIRSFVYFQRITPGFYGKRKNRMDAVLNGEDVVFSVITINPQKTGDRGQKPEVRRMSGRGLHTTSIKGSCQANRKGKQFIDSRLRGNDNKESISNAEHGAERQGERYTAKRCNEPLSRPVIPAQAGIQECGRWRCRPYSGVRGNGSLHLLIHVFFRG